MSERVAVIGSGSWGTTLAALLAEKGLDCRLWVRRESEAERMLAVRRNSRFLPDVELPANLTITGDTAEAFDKATIAVLVVPMRTLPENVAAIREQMQRSALLVSCVKGLDVGTGERVSEIVSRDIGASWEGEFVALSGPNLSREVAAKEPAATVLASSDIRAAERARDVFATPWFRGYTSDDVAGVELAGALKNIIALGAGMSDGLGLGNNAKASLLTRGLAEMTRVGVASGANALTFAGLAGVGDLVATCNSTQSRNHYVGEQLAAGKSLEEITTGMDMVAEGVDTTRGAIVLARRLGVEMPIAEGIYQVLYEGLSVRAGLERLMSRPAGEELRGMSRP